MSLTATIIAPSPRAYVRAELAISRELRRARTSAGLAWSLYRSAQATGCGGSDLARARSIVRDSLALIRGLRRRAV